MSDDLAIRSVLAASAGDVAQRSAAFLAADGVSSSELVPWMFCWDDQIVVNKDGSLLACFSLAGLDIDSSSIDDNAAVREQLLYALGQLQDQGITVEWQVRRRRATQYRAAAFPEPVSARIGELQREAFERQTLYVNSHYVSLTQQGWNGGDQLVARLGRALAAKQSLLAKTVAVVKAGFAAAMGQPDFAHESAEELDQAAGRFTRLLVQFQGSLAQLRMQALRGDELAAHLSHSMSPADRNFTGLLPQEDFLDTTLPRNWIDSSRRDVLMFEGNQPRLYGAAYTLQLARREQVSLNLFDALMAAPVEFSFGEAFKLLSSSQGERAVDETLRYHNMRRFAWTAYASAALTRGVMDEDKADPERGKATDEAKALKSAVAAGSQGLGLWYAGLTVLAESPEQLKQDCLVVEKLLQAARLAPMRESLHKLSTFMASVPGGHRQVARWFKITTANFCDLSPVRTVAPGEPVNAFLSDQTGTECPALLVLPTRHNTPYYFTGYVGQLGHTLILGPSGTGKTTLVNLAWSAYRKYPGARVIGLDRDYSMRTTMLLQGGNYIDLTPEKHGAGGACMGPLRALLADGDLSHLAWCVDWIELLASQRGYRPTSMDRQRLEVALRSLARMGQGAPEMLTLSSVVVQLDGTTELAQNLVPWTRGNVLGDYFDNNRDDLALQGLDGIEAGVLLESEELARPFLSYVFYRISSLLRRSADARGSVPFPTLIVVPEVAHFLQNDVFTAELDKWLTTLRKLTAAVWMDTQSPDKLLESRAYAALRDNVATVIFTPNRKAMSGSLASKYMGEFRLSEEELQFIASGVTPRDYFIKQEALSRRISLGLEPDVMAYLRSDKRAQLLMERHMAESGDAWRDAYINELLGRSE